MPAAPSNAAVCLAVPLAAPEGPAAVRRRREKNEVISVGLPGPSGAKSCDNQHCYEFEWMAARLGLVDCLTFTPRPSRLSAKPPAGRNRSKSSVAAPSSNAGDGVESIAAGGSCAACVSLTPPDISWNCWNSPSAASGIATAPPAVTNRILQYGDASDSKTNMECASESRQPVQQEITRTATRAAPPCLRMTVFGRRRSSASSSLSRSASSCA
jgi:hypothetical protein